MSQNKVQMLDKGEIVSISNGILNVEFLKYNGTYNIIYKENGRKCLISNCCVAINYYDEGELIEFKSLGLKFKSSKKNIEDAIGKGLQLIFETETKDSLLDFAITLRFYDNFNFCLIDVVEIKSKSKNTLKLHSISPLNVRNGTLNLTGTSNLTNFRNISFFKNGYQSWSGSKILFGSDKDRRGPPLVGFAKIIMDNQDYGIQGRYYSEYVTAITDLTSRNSVIMGFVTLKDQLSRIVLDHDNDTNLKHLTAFGCLDGITLKEGEFYKSETLYVGFKTDNLGYYGLIEYAKAVKKLKEKTPFEDKVLTGWCSWYYYFTKVHDKDLIENLNYFEKNRDEFSIDLFQLDDGYQENIGDYLLLNEKFNDGLVPLFLKVQEIGFRAGIWTAPFFATKKSELFKRHPDWFLQNKKGKLIKVNFNWGNWQYALDVSKDVVLDYIFHLFQNLKQGLFSKDSIVPKEPLITFFKIDFIYSVIPYDADFEDKTLTRAQIYYNAVKRIRDAIGEDSYLLGCGAPLGPSVGLVDSMRIGTDTAPTWNFLGFLYDKFNIGVPSMRTAILSTLYRSFMHKYFWVNDTDCLMVRETDTKLTNDEVKTQLTIFGLSGGQILISDNMYNLSEKSKQKAKLLLPPYNPDGFDPIPTDILTNKIPTTYLLETDGFIGKRYLVACCLNWLKKPIEGRIKISELIPNLDDTEKNFLIFDFWNQQYLGQKSKDEVISLGQVAPHTCSYLSILSIDTKKYNKSNPIVLSSTLHISQGCLEIKNFKYLKEKKQLQASIELQGKREGKIFLLLPIDLKISKCQNCESFKKIESSKENLWEISLAFINSTKLSIQLS